MDDKGVVGLAAAVHQRLPSLADELVERLKGLPEYQWSWAAMPVPYLRAVCLHHLDAMVRGLTTPTADLSTMHDAGRRAAQVGVPLAAVLHAYRAGARLVWEALLEEAEDARTLIAATAEIWAFADAGAEAVTISYRDASSVRLRQDERSRSAVVEALLDGRVTGTGASWQAADALHLPYEGEFAVVVAEAELGVEPLDGVQSRLDALGIASAWRLTPEMQIGVVSIRDGLERLVTLLRRIAVRRVGVSPCYAGLGLTPQAFRFARIAMEGAESVAVFDDHPLGAVLVGSPDAAVRAARIVLGPVTADAELLATLTCWFEERGSATRAGQRLHCHANTVRYRLRRIERLTGRSTTDPRALAELYIALEAVRRIPALTKVSTG
ncbi:PucR family transcriptional regulator [Lentzea tibetensis]|uniref:PucR family transcriptional regulator n=1 Tax=Lentzea tibetensis TaxID=2591470 RepID=A0A563ER11_9PSEU|nr:helix-turn-helix domain-containing protein [Lentzea tibetensis]TWP50195.1 PucR family transcriptional regulator [Lentzea tibetensis]